MGFFHDGGRNTADMSQEYSQLSLLLCSTMRLSEGNYQGHNFFPITCYPEASPDLWHFSSATTEERFFQLGRAFSKLSIWSRDLPKPTLAAIVVTDVTARPASNNPGLTLSNSACANSHFQTPYFSCLWSLSCFLCDHHQLVFSPVLLIYDFQNSDQMNIWVNSYQHLEVLTLFLMVRKL